MADKFIPRGKLVFGNLGNDVRRWTVIDHFCFRPDACVCRCLMVAINLRNCFRSLLTAACHNTLSIGADLYVITRPEIIFGFTITAFVDWFHHQLVELRLQR